MFSYRGTADYRGLSGYHIGNQNRDKGSPLRGSFSGPGQAADRLHPGGYVLSPKAQYPLRDMDEQFDSGWRRTRNHDN
ncbi:hypothetical protein F2Q69_00046722 [Brassica cretica]|uniref:Uncharacterized protein n=1 Tax=Brassica cretica TaxID=69181 RepID=A0A8S9PZ14_BRACR|nr:hypothetical protein F2Q69_00046722 [Brassica cretica]